MEVVLRFCLVCVLSRFAFVEDHSQSNHAWVQEAIKLNSQTHLGAPSSRLLHPVCLKVPYLEVIEAYAAAKHPQGWKPPHDPRI